MTVERYIRVIAGLFIMTSLALGIEGSPLFVSSWALAFKALRTLVAVLSCANAAAFGVGTAGSAVFFMAWRLVGTP